MRARGLRAKPARFAPSTKRTRRGTVLVFRLAQPTRLLVTVYGPGPSCQRLATFSRRGRPGMNQIPFSGSLFGRPLAPGRYAIVLEAVRNGVRTYVGRVLVVVLTRDGREGGSRSLAAPDCGGGRSVVEFVASVGGGVDRLVSGSARGAASARDASGSGGVAGVSAAPRGGERSDELPLLPNLPALPALPSISAPSDFDIPGWALPVLGVVAIVGAAALLAAAIRRRREYAGWD